MVILFSARNRARFGALLVLLLSGALILGGPAAPRAAADVGLTKSVDNPTPAPGQNVTYTLSYTCSQTECANGLLTDAVPAGMEFVGWTPDPSTVDVAGSSVPAAGSTGGTLRIKLLTLAPGTTARITVVLRYPNWTTPDGTKATNTAVLTADNETTQSASADTTAQVQPSYQVGKGVQASSQDGRTVTYQFSPCPKSATDAPANVNLSDSHLVDQLPAGAVVDVSRSPGWTENPAGSNKWVYQLGKFEAVNGFGACKYPGVLVVHYPQSAFPDGTSSKNTVDLNGTPLGGTDQQLATGSASSPTFQTPSVDVTVTAGKTWVPNVTSGDLATFALFATNTGAPATSLTMTDPGAGTTPNLYNWLLLQSVQLDAWSPSSIAATFQYQLNGDAAWQTFTPGTPFNGLTQRRITIQTGAGNPANDALGVPSGRWISGLRLTWTGPIPTGWSPGNSVQVTGQAVYLGHDGTPAPAPLHNCLDAVATGAAGSTAVANACADATIHDATNLGAAKTTVSGAVVAPGQNSTFQVIAYNRTGRTLTTPLVLFDLLPPGMVYVDGSARPDPAWPLAPAPQQIAVLPGTGGRQLLRMTWPAGAPDMTYLNEDHAYRMLFDAQVAGGASTGTVVNDVYVTADPKPTNLACMYNGVDTSAPDTYDVNGNGDTTERLCHASSQVQIEVPAVLRAYKEVKGDLDQAFGSSAATTPGGRIDYRMTVRNDAAKPVTNFVAYDHLPTPGDSYVLNSGAPRGSAWAPSLVAPLTSSDPTVVIEYTTAKNPCTAAQAFSVSDPAGCDPNAQWTTAFPGPGEAAWFRVTRPGTLAPGASFTLTWSMVAAVDAPDATFAFNSFAYSATDADGSPLLPAEPAKVGVGIQRPPAVPNSLGDFVWQDVNANGIQDPGEPGVPGVKVWLLDAAGRLVRDKNGTPVTTTTDATGHYRFGGLPDGGYAVRFDLGTIPPGATVTAQNASSNPAVNSAADPATGITPVVTLSGGQFYQNLDMGLIYAVTPPIPPTPTPIPPTPTPIPTVHPTPSPEPHILPHTGLSMQWGALLMLLLGLLSTGGIGLSLASKVARRTRH